ncbi:MAG: helix-turn-helix transcriptional regulator [Anaerolineales bacterium]|jgi:two-component system response regulator NreC
MSFWRRLLRKFSFRRSTDTLTFDVDLDLKYSLQRLAKRQQRPEDELAAELLSFALAQRNAAEARLELWRDLSPREQQVVALICLGYTNRQIANQLVISTETVKSHVRNALRKFSVRSKVELRQVLADWDFSTWR